MSSGLYNTHKIDFDTTLDLTRLKPYGDTMNDGKVQTSFTLPVKDDERGEEAARQIAKNHSNGIVSDKLLTNDKCLCKSVRAWLYSVGKVNTKLMSVTQKLLKTRGILRSGDDQDVTDPCVHQYRHWIVDHWFIIDG